MPVKRDASDGAADEGEGDDHDAGGYSDVKHTTVSNRITIRKDEEHSDYDVAKGKPVGAVGDEWVFAIGDIQPFSYFQDPSGEASIVLWIEVTRAASENRCQEVHFSEQGKSSHATDDQSKDDNSYDKSKSSESLFRHDLFIQVLRLLL